VPGGLKHTLCRNWEAVPVGTTTGCHSGMVMFSSGGSRCVPVSSSRR
jgi:hypothetical protein